MPRELRKLPSMTLKMVIMELCKVFVLLSNLLRLCVHLQLSLTWELRTDLQTFHLSY